MKDVIKTIELNKIQALSIGKRLRFQKYLDIEVISNQIHVYSRNAKEHSYYFPIIQKISLAVRIIESILWNYYDVNKRLEKLQKKNDYRQIL